MPNGDRADFGPTQAWGTAGSPSKGNFSSPPAGNRDAGAETVAYRSGASSTEPSGRSDPSSGAVVDLGEFKRTLTELGLASDAELGAFQVDESLGVLGLARALVRAGRLTPYQSAAIYQRKNRGLVIGDYLILDKLGQGGMGVVFKARHRQSGRLGALKILPPSFARDRSAVMRFKREIEAAGRLKHPNLVAALDSAEDRGVHFLVMEYVAGSDLDRLIRSRGPMTPFEAIDSVIQAARGLEAAHAAGIVHRDIKPGNLMLDTAGAVRVLDLGLARFVEAANPFGQASGTRLTDSGMCMGTIDYMAPEQAEDSRQADHRADIYSLGCTLFYLLTGREPFNGPTALKRMMAHQQQPAPKLRAARPDAPIRLESVFQKMMAKEPAGRPASMAEVIALLEPCRWAARSAAAVPTSTDRPASAPAQLFTLDQAGLNRAAATPTERAPTLIAPLNKTIVEQVNHDLSLDDLAMDVRIEDPPIRLPVTLLSRASAGLHRLRPRSSHSIHPLRSYEFVVSAVLAIVLVGALLVRVAWFSPPAKPRTAVPSASDAAGPTEVTAVHDGDTGTDRQLIAEAPIPAQPHPEATDRAASTIASRSERPETKLTSADAGSVYSDRKLAPPAKKPISGTTSSKVAAAMPVSPAVPFVEVSRFIGHVHQWVEGICVLRNGRALLSAGVDGTVRLWDIPSGREIRCLWHPGFVRPVVALPDGERAVTGCIDGWVRLWDLKTGQEVRQLVRHSGQVTALALTPDGRQVVSGALDGVLQVSDVEKGGEIRRFEGQISPVWSVAISADGQLVLAGGKDGVARVGKMNSRDPLEPLVGHDPDTRIMSVGFSPDSRCAASGGEDASIILWDLNRKQMERRLRLEGDGLVRALEFQPDGEGVVYGTQHGALAVWNPETGARRHVAQTGRCHSALTLLPGGGVATADDDGLARIWQASPEISLARTETAAGQHAPALAAYRKAIAAHPDDVRLLIERGRLLTELGNFSAADVDFSRAATLAPDNPQLFVDCGWWVAGPYSLGLDTPGPIEAHAAAFPATPPPPPGQEVRQWQRVGTAMYDLVEMRAISQSDDQNVTCYALGIVYSATQREVVILVGADDQARLWLNGNRLLDSLHYTPHGHHAIGATLRAGRNIILAKVVNQGGGHGLFLRISGAPQDFLRVHNARKEWDAAARDYDQALTWEPSIRNGSFFADAGTALGELGRWKDAAAAFQRAQEFAPEDYWSYYNLLHACLGQGDLTSYRRVYQETIAKFDAKTDPGMSNNLAWLAALIPSAVEPRSRYDELLRRAKRIIDTKQAGYFYLNTYGALLYRAGQYPSAVNFLNRSIRDPKNPGSALDYVLLAMATHRLKQGDAQSALKRAGELATRGAPSWDKRVELRALLAEAKAELKQPPAR